MACNKEEIMKVGATPIWHLADGENFFFKSKLSVDADGAPRAYHPNGHSGLDALGNAGKPGNWWALVTDNGKRSGNPIIQGAQDPAPGFYISTTSLEDETKDRTDPHRYVDAEQIPFIVLPPEVMEKTRAKLGDFAVVVNTKNAQLAFAIFADQGPAHEVGEGSIALADTLGIPSSPRSGGASGGVIYLVFPGSGNRKPRTLAEIASEGRRLFENWGGRAQLRECFPDIPDETLHEDFDLNLTGRLTFAQVKAHVSANNKSAISNEAIIALIWKESSFDPLAKSTTSTATGLMQITKPAVDTVNNTTPPGTHFDHSEMTDPVKNIQCGTFFLKFLMRTFAKKEALEHYGTGPGYADNILTCETCLTTTPPPPDPQVCLNAIHT